MNKKGKKNYKKDVTEEERIAMLERLVYQLE
jgi:hypothetical protein